jgi:hypothetical protein
VNVFPAVVGLLVSRVGCVSSRGLFVSRLTDHGWKHIYLGFYNETGGCDCSSKELLMMGKILPETR